MYILPTFDLPNGVSFAQNPPALAIHVAAVQLTNARGGLKRVSCANGGLVHSTMHMYSNDLAVVAATFIRQAVPFPSLQHMY